MLPAVRAAGYTFLAATALMWSSNGVASRVAFDAGVAPRDLAAIRLFGAAILFGTGAMMALRRLSLRELGTIAAFGMGGITVAQYLYYEAIDRIDVAVALVIIYLNPLLVAGWERLVHGDRLRRRSLVAMVVAIGGVALMVAGRDGGLGAMSTAGLVLALATAAATSGQTLMAGRLPTRLSAVQRTGGAMIAAASVWIVANPPWTIPWDSISGSAALGTSASVTVPVVLVVAWVTIVGTALPYVTLIAGTTRLGAGPASVTTMIEPVVAAVLAWIVLGQKLAPLQIVGIAAALGGILVVELTRQPHEPAAIG